MPSPRMQPNFEDFYLNVGPHAWLHQSRWEDEDSLFASKTCRRPTLLLGSGPKLLHRRKSSRDAVVSSWLLKDMSRNEPLFRADLQIFQQARSSYGLLWIGPLTPSDDQAIFEVFVSLISLIFLVGKPDQLRLVGSIPQLPPLIARLGECVGEQRTLFSLPPKAWRPGVPPLVAIPALQVDRWSWRNAEQLPTQAQHLRHIEKRLQRWDAHEKIKKPRRNLLARLFRPRIDDALF